MSEHTSRDNLTRGENYLQQHPDFTLVGRDEELAKLSGILMRRHANNVLLVGAGGVGCSAICLGLQASKADPDAPFDIIGKRFFWLDVDGLFESGDYATINDSFQRALKTLRRSPDTVLIIDDSRDFIEASRNNGCTSFINAIMRGVRRGQFQAILESRDEDLDTVLRCHSDMRELFTMLDVQEPSEEILADIVTDAMRHMQRHHRVKINTEAIDTAISLTNKYRVRDLSLSRAQPERTLNLIDRAFTTYRQSAHSTPPILRQHEAELAQVEAALAGEDVAALQGLERADLESLKQVLVDKLIDARRIWQADQDQLRDLYKNQRDGEELIRRLEEDLEEQRLQEAARDAGMSEHADATMPEAEPAFQSFSAKLSASGFESEAVNAIKSRIDDAERAVARNREDFEALTKQINSNLCLTPTEIFAEFSSISKIPTDKLNQDEREKLIQLDKLLAARVFGQDHAVSKLAGAVRVARAGLKDPDKPQAAFLYAGPSGVGKTEMAKALTATLLDDERALLRFDMSEYMEKHAVAKLIGAPPGYEGYEAGGILTNSMRKNPHAIILFDEIEKAHDDVFNVLLQVLDDGRLTDNRGLTVSFSEAIIIMTTNIGQPHFLDPGLDFEQAVAATMEELDGRYRPEFLNRFNGRENIVCFNRLDLPVIERIARREIDKMNQRIAAQGSNLTIAMEDRAIADLCRDKYAPERGARGIPGYFASTIYPAVANTMLLTPEAEGVMTVAYDAGSGELNVSLPAADRAATAALESTA